MGASEFRLARLRAALADKGVDAFLVRDTSNIQWLTSFDSVFDGEPAHALYVDAARAVLHTDSRYVTACANAAAGTPISVDSRRETHAQFAARLWGSAAEAGKAGKAGEAGKTDAAAETGVVARGSVGLEDSISLSEFRKIEAELAPADVGKTAGVEGPARVKRLANIRETSDLVVNLRAVKDADEIRRMRTAQAITDAAFSHIVRFMRPGMTEREVQLELEGFMLRNGAAGLAFSSIVATGANGASPHAIPGDARLEAGQCVVMDFGARTLGYCSDMTRMVFIGEPDARLRDAYAVLRRANEQVEAMLRPGVTGAEAHELAECILAEGGYEGKMGHGLGHGVGIDIHEEPVLAPRNKQPLVAGNVVTVEPGIYLPGQFGMRLEDFGVIAESGFDVLTQSTHDMVVV